MNVETELKMASQNNSDEIYDCENPKFNPYDLVSFMAGPAVSSKLNYYGCINVSV